MATPEQQQLLSLAEEATCPICLGYFADPVSVQCGHTFCTPCITLYWEGVQGGPYPCPQCRETAPTNTLRPNRHLASIVQILAQGAPPRTGPRGEGHLMCAEHDEKLKLFCQEDKTPICVICRESRGHRAHTVTPILEATQEYKDKFQSYLDNMRRKLENILQLKLEEETKTTDLEEKVKIQRAQITRVFNKIQQFLEKEKCHHLSNLEEKTKRTLREIREKVTELNKQQASARDQITELEAKCQQSGVELLKDVKNILSRYEDLIILNPPEVFDGEEKKTVKNEMKKKKEEEGEEDLEKKIIETLELSWARSFAASIAAGQQGGPTPAGGGRPPHQGTATATTPGSQDEPSDTAHQGPSKPRQKTHNPRRHRAMCTSSDDEPSDPARQGPSKPRQKTHNPRRPRAMHSSSDDEPSDPARQGPSKPRQKTHNPRRAQAMHTSSDDEPSDPARQGPSSPASRRLHPTTLPSLAAFRAVVTAGPLSWSPSPHTPHPLHLAPAKLPLRPLASVLSPLVSAKTAGKRKRTPTQQPGTEPATAVVPGPETPPAVQSRVAPARHDALKQLKRFARQLVGPEWNPGGHGGGRRDTDSHPGLSGVRGVSPGRGVPAGLEEARRFRESMAAAQRALEEARRAREEGKAAAPLALEEACRAREEAREDARAMQGHLSGDRGVP